MNKPKQAPIILCALSQLFSESSLQQAFEQAARYSLPKYLTETVASLEGQALLAQSQFINATVKQDSQQLLDWLLQRRLAQIREADCLALIGLCIEKSLDQSTEQERIALPELVFQGDLRLLTKARIMLLHWWPARLQRRLLLLSPLKGQHEYIDTFIGDLRGEASLNSVMYLLRAVSQPLYCLQAHELTALATDQQLKQWWRQYMLKLPLHQ